MAHYQCPFCNQHQAITQPKHSRQTLRFYIEENIEGTIGAAFDVLSCANPSCRKTAVHLTVGSVAHIGSNRYSLDSAKPILLRGRIIPSGAAKVYPDYIPSALLEDYREACLIKDLSPKAAATLVRRCLQGMIRDFCDVKKRSLDEEIKTLRELVSSGQAPAGVSIQAVDAIDHVRGIGNIGAHMEKDINLIIPVEADEVELLIGLVEMLFEDWYVTRHRRNASLAALSRLADAKKALKNGGGGAGMGAGPQEA